MYNKVNIYTCLHVNVFLTAGSRWQSKWMWCRFTNHCWTWNPRKGICNSAKPNSLFTLHAWLRGKVISLYVCCRCHYRRHENHQVWRYACRHRYVQLVNTKNLSKSAKKKVASVCFESLVMAHKHDKQCVYVGHAYLPHLLQPMCFLLMRTTAKYYCTSK